MRIGIPREIKPDEHRVALTPAGVRELREAGAHVIVERGAGEGSAISDEAYSSQGATLVPDAKTVFSEVDLILKVKEPLEREVQLMHPEQTIFTFLHLASAPQLADALCAAGVRALAYETVADSAGHLPLLAPMSEIAGCLATQVGATSLEKSLGGRGLLLGGVAGVTAANVVVVGGGVVGRNAARVALGMGARVTILDKSLGRLRELEWLLDGQAETIHASKLTIEELLPRTDLVIGAVLVPGAKSPCILERAQLSLMRTGTVLVDVSIDQGGCFETSRPTTHSAPTFTVDGITHYCVSNMPGAVPITSTHALTSATLPYILTLVEKGIDNALASDLGIQTGLNIADGEIVHPVVAAALDRKTQTKFLRLNAA